MPPFFMFVTRCTVLLSSTTSLFSRCVLDRNAHGFSATSSGGFPPATVLVILNTEGSVQNRCMHVHVEVRTTSVQVYMHTHMGRSKPWKRLRAMNFFSRMLTTGASLLYKSRAEALSLDTTLRLRISSSAPGVTYDCVQSSLSSSSSLFPRE